MKHLLHFLAIVPFATSLWSQDKPAYQFVPLENPFLERFEADHWSSADLDFQIEDLDIEAGEYEYWQAVAKAERGSRSEVNEAIDLWEISAKDGFKASYSALAFLYQNGANGISRSERKAIQWLEKGATTKDRYSQLLLGERLFFGNGIKKDLNKAKVLLEEMVQSKEAFYSGPKDQRLIDLLFPKRDESSFKPMIGALNSPEKEALAFANYYLGKIAQQNQQPSKAQDYFVASSQINENSVFGNPIATLEAAKNFATGTGVSKDVEASQRFLDHYKRLRNAGYQKNSLEFAQNHILGHLFLKTNSGNMEEVITKEVGQTLLAIAQSFDDPTSPNHNPAEALQWLELAVEHDSNEARIHLAEFLSRKNSEFQDPVRSFSLLSSISSENFNYSAQVNLGICYQKGIGVEKDTARAQEILNSYQEYNYIAYLANQGDGISSLFNALQYMEYLDKGVESGNSRALAFKGAISYLNEDGTRDLKKSENLLLRSVQLKDPLGMTFLANLYYYNYRDRRDKKAIQLLREAYDLGSVRSIYSLVEWRRHSLDINPAHLEPLNVFNRSTAINNGKFDTNIPYYRDQIKLLETFLATATHETSALNLLAYFKEEFLKLKYEKSDNYPEELIQEIFEQYTIASKTDPYATYNLGRLYLEGDLVAKDHDTAFSYFEKAAQEQHPAAHYQLGKFYAEGISIDQNFEIATEHYSLAAIRMDISFSFRVKAIQYLMDFYSDGTHTPVDRDQYEFWGLILLNEQTNEYGYFYRNIPSGDRIKTESYLQNIVDFWIDDQRYERAYNLLSGLIYWSNFSAKTILFSKAAFAEAKLRSIQQKTPSLTEVDAQLRAALINLHPKAFLAGAIYHRGLGNPERSIRFYRKAVQLGDPDAYYELALCYWNGIGIPQNEDKSIEHLFRAAALNQMDAMASLVIMNLYHYEGAPSDEETAKLIEKLENLNHSLAPFLRNAWRIKSNETPSGSLRFNDGIAGLI